MRETLDAPMTAARFRAQFPALAEHAWLATPGVAPGCSPVVAAVERACVSWRDGSFDWMTWEADAEAARTLFARRMGAPAVSIALVATLADAAATVAANLAAMRPRRGTVVLGAREFRSALMPWMALAEQGFTPRLVHETAGVAWTDAVLAAIDRDTTFVALSEVQSATGTRLDVEAVVARCRAVGALCFLNLTQSAGVLPQRLDRLGVDFAAAHGYKFLLAPRGASWLYVREEHLARMRALAPNWKTVPDPYPEVYGAPQAIATSARRLDASLAWFSWAGARVALETLATCDEDAIAAHALALAARLRDECRGAGLAVVGDGGPQSHVVSVDVGAASPDAVLDALAQRRVRCGVRDGRLRFGFHYFNDEADVDAAVDALTSTLAAMR